MSHRAIAVRGVRFGYPGGPPVLAGADLGVPRAGRVALLGANGSGKSTLLRCLSGALRPAGGTVEVDGSPVDHSRAGLRRHRQVVQLVTQDPDDQLFSASVTEDVSFGPMNLGLGDAEVVARVDEALALMAVDHLRDRPTHQLSFGERKRVAIAGAMAMRPCVLALDEPTAGLDPVAVDDTMAALTRLHDAGTSLVVATHDVDLALGWADTVAVIVDGTVAQGPPVEVFDDRDLLGRARLRTPWVLDVAAHLAAARLIPSGASPRDLGDLLALVPLDAPDHGAGAGRTRRRQDGAL